MGAGPFCLPRCRPLANEVAPVLGLFDSLELHTPCSCAPHEQAHMPFNTLASPEPVPCCTGSGSTRLETTQFGYSLDIWLLKSSAIEVGGDALTHVHSCDRSP